MTEDRNQDPLDQLIDLFVYAPVGLLYEYQEVIPKLVRRGRSQVQIARVVGQMAVNRGGPAQAFNQLAGGVAGLLARQITEIGASIGLAPPSGSTSAKAPGTPPPPRPEDQPPALTASSDAEPAVASVDLDDSGSAEAPSVGAAMTADDGVGSSSPRRQLPIAGYDGLTAKEIIALLDELDQDQLDRIRAHEEKNRARKTVLGKLDRLAR